MFYGGLRATLWNPFMAEPRDHCARSALLGLLFASSALAACSNQDSALFSSPNSGGGKPALSGAGGKGSGNNGDSAGTGGTAGTTANTNGGAAGASATGGSAGAASPPPPDLIGDVAFSVPSQAFQGALAVGLSTSLANAEIRYTTDRSLPSASSLLYTGTPLSLTTTTALRAQAFVSGVQSGKVSTALYIARDFDTASNLPLLILDGFGQGEPTDKDVWFDGALMTFEPQAGEARLSALPALAARAAHHNHGQSSANFPQKSYRVELRDNTEADAHYPLLGMPAESDWVLVAPYYDRALIRNTFMYGLGRDMGLQAPRVAYAEVYVNHAQRALTQSDYAGVYYVTETIKNSKRRTNLQKLNASDLSLPAVSGGYIMKFDWAVSEPPTLPCVGAPPINNRGTGSCWTDLEVVDPEPLAAEQRAFITGFIQPFHDSLHTTPLGDYASFIDLPSFVNYFIINELSRSLDEFTRSAYFYKDRDGKLNAGPLWDYNFALDCGRPTSMATEGWQYPLRPGASDWFPKLMTDPAFVAALTARWKVLRQGLLSEAAIEQRIQALTAPLQQAAARDLQRWPVAQVFSNAQQYSGPTASDWQGQVDAIREWIPKRLAWMDTQFP